MVLIYLLLMPFESEELTRFLNHSKEKIADVQQHTQSRRLPSFTEDTAYIEELKGKLNEAMDAFNVCELFLSFN